MIGWRAWLRPMRALRRRPRGRRGDGDGRDGLRARSIGRLPLLGRRPGRRVAAVRAPRFPRPTLAEAEAGAVSISELRKSLLRPHRLRTM